MKFELELKQPEQRISGPFTAKELLTRAEDTQSMRQILCYRPECSVTRFRSGCRSHFRGPAGTRGNGEPTSCCRTS